MITAVEFVPHVVDVYGMDERKFGTKKVTSLCARCSVSNEAKYRRSRGRTLYWEVVSPSGKQHLARELGLTECGIDATGPDWWWAL